MRINEAALQQVLRNYAPRAVDGGQTGRGSASDSAGPTSDQVNISAEGQSLLRTIQAAQQASDVREQRVAEIRTQIRTGQYLLDAQKIANRMLGLGDE